MLFILLVFLNVYLSFQCKHPAALGDHILINYNLSTSTKSFSFSLPSYKANHVQLADKEHPFETLLLGSCPGDVVQSSFPISAFQPYLEDENMLAGPNSPSLPSWLKDKQEDEEDDRVELSCIVKEVTTDQDFSIFQALNTNNLTVVMQKVEDGVGINAVDEWGSTPLMVAVRSMNSILFSGLLNALPKCDVNKAMPAGHTALFFTVSSSSSSSLASSFLRALIRKGANPSPSLQSPEEAGTTPLHFAALNADYTLAKTLLVEGKADPLAEREGDGKTPFDLLDTSALSSSEAKRFVDLFVRAVESWEGNKNEL